MSRMPLHGTGGPPVPMRHRRATGGGGARGGFGGGGGDGCGGGGCQKPTSPASAVGSRVDVNARQRAAIAAAAAAIRTHRSALSERRAHPHCPHVSLLPKKASGR
eukprot:824815-Prymnesium_polylepis.1